MIYPPHSILYEYPYSNTGGGENVMHLVTLAFLGVAAAAT
jgi:hypothetical protein